MRRRLVVLTAAVVLMTTGCVDVETGGGERLAAIEARLAALEARVAAIDTDATSAADGVANATESAAVVNIVPIASLRITEAPTQSIQGEVVAIVDGYKLRIRDQSGTQLVDAGREGILPAGFSPAVGDRLTISGVNDDLIDFDATLIVTSDGRSFPIDRHGEWE